MKHLGYSGPGGGEVAACHAIVNEKDMTRRRPSVTCSNCQRTRRFRKV